MQTELEIKEQKRIHKHTPQKTLEGIVCTECGEVLETLIYEETPTNYKTLGYKPRYIPHPYKPSKRATYNKIKCSDGSNKRLFLIRDDNFRAFILAYNILRTLEEDFNVKGVFERAKELYLRNLKEEKKKRKWLRRQELMMFCLLIVLKRKRIPINEKQYFDIVELFVKRKCKGVFQLQKKFPLIRYTRIKYHNYIPKLFSEIVIKQKLTKEEEQAIYRIIIRLISFYNKLQSKKNTSPLVLASGMIYTASRIYYDNHNQKIKLKGNGKRMNPKIVILSLTSKYHSEVPIRHAARYIRKRLNENEAVIFGKLFFNWRKVKQNCKRIKNTH